MREAPYEQILKDLEELIAWKARLLMLVEIQANDPVIWVAPSDHVRQELRKLHAYIEGSF